MMSGTVSPARAQYPIVSVTWTSSDARTAFVAGYGPNPDSKRIEAFAVDAAEDIVEHRPVDDPLVTEAYTRLKASVDAIDFEALPAPPEIGEGKPILSIAISTDVMTDPGAIAYQLDKAPAPFVDALESAKVLAGRMLPK